jgi:hypothetical protein
MDRIKGAKFDILSDMGYQFYPLLFMATETITAAAIQLHPA